LCFKFAEWERALLEHGGMEVAEVEARTEHLSCTVPQREDLELANHVAGGLSRPGDIALDLACRVAFRQQGVVPEYSIACSRVQRF
jgi:hypothetical protein